MKNMTEISPNRRIIMWIKRQRSKKGYNLRKDPEIWRNLSLWNWIYFSIFFLMWTIFKVFIEFVTILLLFYVFVFVFGPKACGILAPWPGILSTPPALEGEVLTTGPPGKSLKLDLGDSLPESSGSSLGWDAISGLKLALNPEPKDT